MPVIPPAIFTGKLKGQLLAYDVADCPGVIQDGCGTSAAHVKGLEVGFVFAKDKHVRFHNVLNVNEIASLLAIFINQ